MKNNKKGFTLIELLVVIAIIGLLSTLAVVSLNNARQKARDARRQSDLKQISTAMELYMSQNDEYPTNGATCGAAGVVSLADTPNIDALCSGSGIGVTDGTNVFLANIPAEPTTGSTYSYEGTGTTYCISADLEGGGFFVCTNGSCFEQASNCTEV
ncbi:MAG TPA: type II secretion system protein [bacterium]|nr:type II secretion system protein [bacterium]